MKRRSTFAIALFSVLFLTACKKEASVNIDQNRIYSEYEVVYDNESNQTTTTAIFRVDQSSGKKIELTYPSRVGFNNEALAYRKMVGQYDNVRSGNHLNGAFKYFDNDQKEYSNSGGEVSPIDIPFGLNSISRSGNFFLPWNGAALQSGETVEVTISGGSQSGSKTFNATAVGSSYIVLDQFQLNNLVAGTATIQITRQKTAGLQSSNLSGGRITSIYKGRKVNINITG